MIPSAAATSSWPSPANWRSSTTLRRDRVLPRQPPQGIVEGEEVLVRVGAGPVGKVHAVEPAAPLLPGAAPGGLDEDAAHGLGRRGEEVAPAVPAAAGVAVDQAQVSLVDQGRGLEHLPGLLAAPASRAASVRSSS